MEIRKNTILAFVGGIVIGFFLAVGLGMLWNKMYGETAYNNEDVVMFEKPKSKINAKDLTVFQVLPDGSALAKVENFSSWGMVVLLLPETDNGYYDDQSITVPRGKSLMQIGIFKYENKEEMVKTVPIVKVYDD